MNRALLEQPFEPSQIKQREGRKGQLLDYVEGHAVIQRLNDAFEGHWSFEVVSHAILEESDEIVVLGKLAADGVVKMQFGSSQLTRDRGTKTLVSLADDLKAATTDALKKCATLLGVGLHLYAEKAGREGRRGQGLPQSATPASKPTGDGKAGEPPAASAQGKRLDHAQHAAILKLAKQKGWSQVELNQEAVARYGVPVPSLSAHDAARFIRALQGQGA
jgi:hypothetical protein